MLASDPMAQFARWLAEAGERGVPQPTAMVLATTSADDDGGAPRARTVLLKDHGPDGFTFYTNRTSRKGRDLADACRGLCRLPLVRDGPPGHRGGPRAAAVPGRQ